MKLSHIGALILLLTAARASGAAPAWSWRVVKPNFLWVDMLPPVFCSTGDGQGKISVFPRSSLVDSLW